MNEPAYRVALPFKMGEWVRDTYSGVKGCVCGYFLHSDLTLSVTLARVVGDDLKQTDFLASRLERTSKDIG